MAKDINCSSAYEFGEKLAELDPNLNLVYDKAKTNFMMPKHLRDNKLSPEQASQLLAGMRAVAPHGALDKTRLDWNGLQIQGYGSRVHDNERVTRLGRWLHQFDGDQFESAYPDKTQGFGDVFLPFANLVSVPSGMGGVAMHELGHAIDFNGFPADSTPRHLIAATYRNYAPTIWKEHAAWRKGRKAVLDAYSKEKIDPQTTFKTLESGKGAKRVGLGSYWGAGLGTVGGIGATLAGMLALNEMGVDLRHVPGRALALPIVGGAMLGGIGGVGLGNLLAKNPTKREVIVDMMAKQLARKNGMRYGAARSLVEQQLAASDKAPAQPMRKAAELRASGEKLAAQPNPFAAGTSLYTPMLQGARNNLVAARALVPPVARFAGTTIGGPGAGGVTSLASKLGLNYQLNNAQAQLAMLKKLQQPAAPALKRPTP